MASTYSSRQQQTSDPVTRFLSLPVVLNWYTITYIVIFAIAIITRFAGLGDRLMSHDESLHTYYSWLLSQTGDYDHTPLMHGPILFHVTALMYTLFGANDFTSRIYPAVLGVLMVMMPLLFRRWLGNTGALLASIMILISPLLLYHHRYIREDTPSIFYTMVMVWCTFQYVDGSLRVRRKARWLYIFAAAMLGSLGSKEVAFMYIAIFGLFLTIFCGVRLYQHLAKRPGKTLFYFLILPSLLGGVLALIMYCVLAIALASYPTLEGRINYLLSAFQGFRTGTDPVTGAATVASSLEFNMFLMWTLILVIALIVVVAGTALWAFRRRISKLPILEIIIIIALSVVVCSGLIVIEEYSKLPSMSDDLANDPENDIIDTVAENPVMPAVLVWVVSGGVIAALVFSSLKGWWRTLHRFPELDIMILMGTLILPWLTAIPIAMTGASPRDNSTDGLIRAATMMVPLIAVSVVFGLVWNWKRWIISAVIFYSLFVLFFTTLFTNPNGLFTGVVGSLGYWLDQQGVRRGSQPQYYYQMIIMPVYEYLPLIGSGIAMLVGMTSFWSYRRRRLSQPKFANETPSLAAEASGDSSDSLAPSGTEVESDQQELLPALSKEEYRRRELWGEGRLRNLSFPLFTSFWAIYIFIAYTLAGEKMPWLGTHLTLPLIFVTAWVFRHYFDNTDWAKFRQGGWVYLLLLPLLAVAFTQLLSPFAFDRWQGLFGNLTTNEQQARNLWFAMIAVVIVICFLIYLVARRVGWRQFRSMIAVATFGTLSVLTARTAWTAAYINYDYATEYLVYAHAAPGIRTMMEQIEELSRRTAGEMSLAFAWGGNSWPVTWYFRDLTNATFFGGNPTPGFLDGAVAVYASEDIRSRVEPLLGDDYYRFEYMRMWWPSWNYYNLNATRMQEAWDFSPENARGGQIREGLWNIWWNRDYTTYGNAVGENYSLTNWNPGERLYFYVRKDIASQIWNLGLGEGTVLNPLTSSSPNICVENWQPISANFVFDQAGQNPIALNHPIGITTAANGHIFVADENNGRVVEYDELGNYVRDYTGVAGGLPFNRPNGVAAGADGNIWVADTWNYRVGEFSREDGSWLIGWGQPGLFGEAATTEPTDGFWGPRDIEVDAAGNVYVADTGNKRIRVYNAQGEWLRDIGSAGSGLGQLDEPAGIAIGSDRIYVADTWNRRVSVFALDGTPLFTFDVRGWFDDLGNRPYLALDEGRNLLYVTDPDAGRVLVYDMQGNCVGSFGQPSDNPFNLDQFDVTSGITVDELGNVYVVDSSANRIMQFPPFPASVAVIPEDINAINQALFEEGVIAVEAIPIVEEVTENVGDAAQETIPELTVEISPEVTQSQ